MPLLVSVEGRGSGGHSHERQIAPQFSIRPETGSEQPDPTKGAANRPFTECSFDVGHSRFVVDSDDPGLLQELYLFAKELEGVRGSEGRFIWRLVQYTEAGILRPWGWQQQLKSRRD